MPQEIWLKWGTLKGWSDLTDASVALLKEYAALGMSFGAMQQHDTPEQKAILIKVLRQLDGRIFNDWENREMTVDEAVAYIENYGKPTEAPCQ